MECGMSDNPTTATADIPADIPAVDANPWSPWDRLDALGPKAWALIFLAVLGAFACVGRRLAGCCLQSQRQKLRDDYEDELRRGGKLTNRLLLPAPNRVHWSPHYGSNRF